MKKNIEREFDSFLGEKAVNEEGVPNREGR